VVANPPFSDKRWSTGLTRPTPTAASKLWRAARQAGRLRLPAAHHPLAQEHRPGRLHPAARRAVPRQCRGRDPREPGARAHQGIIGLPANLFYGTGIPACILVIDKAGAAARKGIFMIDAAQGFMKDGPRTACASATSTASSTPSHAGRQRPATPAWWADEIEKNDFNLNLPRYIDSSTPEDLQDIDAHLNGGIPEADAGAQPLLGRCARSCAACSAPRPGYLDLAVAPAAIKPPSTSTPSSRPSPAAMNAHFADWRAQHPALKALAGRFHPKALIENCRGLLAHYDPAHRR
jgi:type I restriction enzyme M protein